MAGTKEPGAMTREMALVHTGFLREFFLMPELVRGVFEGNRKRAEIVAEHVGMMSAGLHHHHHGEDREIWPRLLERCPEEVRPLVHGMEKHHERIADLISKLQKQLAAWQVDANVASRDAVARTLDELRPILREHLTEEVEYVLPLIEKHISGDEWDALGAQNLAAMPPESLPLILGLSMYEGDPAAVKDVLDNIPEEARTAIADAAPQAYADYAESLYGTRTPPYWSTIVSRL
jgi:hemerythrin-like domain-containing protein